MKDSFFFIGIGGSGMNGIARIMNIQGFSISGSDRDRDKGNRPEFYKSMENSGIKLFPQNGSGISGYLDCIVTSTAVEAEIPDLTAANKLNIEIIHRSEMLARLVKSLRSIAIAGTSGKSTVTGITGWCLKNAGFEPMMLNGARVLGIGKDESDSDILSGKGEYAVFEADESDGSLVRFHPSIGVLTNITLDHLPMEKLREIFSVYAENISEILVYNADCQESAKIAKFARKGIGFSIDSDSDFQASSLDISGFESSFTIENQRIHLKVPGRHNIENALATYSVLRYLDIVPAECRDLLESFQGISRRFQKKGTANNITVIDDFAHNPDKLRATMTVADKLSKSCKYIFQPHGYGPISFLFDEFVEVFSNGINKDDTLILTPVFYAGGTVNKKADSEMLAEEIRRSGTSVVVMEKSKIPGYLSKNCSPGDHVIVMGARDPSLPGFCQEILNVLESRNFS